MATVSVVVPDVVVPTLVATLRTRYANLIPVGASDSDVALLVIRYWLRQELMSQQTTAIETSYQAALASASASRATAIASAQTTVDTYLPPTP